MAKKKKQKYQQLPNYDIDEEASIIAAKRKKDPEQQEENSQYHDCSDDKTIKHQNSLSSKSFNEQQERQQARSLSHSSDNSSIPSDSSASHHTKRAPAHTSTDRQGGSADSSASKDSRSSASATSTYSGSGSRSGGSSTSCRRKQIKRDRIKDHVKKMILPYKEKDINPRPKVTPLEADPHGGRDAAVAHNKIHRRRSPAINIMGETENDINDSLVKHWNKAEEKVILANIAPALTGEQILSLQEENPSLIQVLQPTQDEILLNDAVREQ